MVIGKLLVMFFFLMLRHIVDLGKRKNNGKNFFQVEGFLFIAIMIGRCEEEETKERRQKSFFHTMLENNTVFLPGIYCCNILHAIYLRFFKPFFFLSILKFLENKK